MDAIDRALVQVLHQHHLLPIGNILCWIIHYVLPPSMRGMERSIPGCCPGRQNRTVAVCMIRGGAGGIRTHVWELCRPLPFHLGTAPKFVFNAAGHAPSNHLRTLELGEHQGGSHCPIKQKPLDRISSGERFVH